MDGKKHEFQLGDSKVVITCHKNPNGGYWEDSSVEIDSIFICVISWEDREKFQQELTDAVNKFKI